MLKRPLPRDRSNDPSHQGQFGQKIAEGRAGGVSGKSRLAFPEFHKVEEAGIIEVRRKTIYETAFFRLRARHRSPQQTGGLLAAIVLGLNRNIEQYHVPLLLSGRAIGISLPAAGPAAPPTARTSTRLN